MSVYDVARVFGIQSGTTVRRWESGKREIPGPAMVLMRWLATGEKPYEPSDAARRMPEIKSS